MTAIQQPRVGGERLGMAPWSPDQINPGAENRSRPRYRSKGCSTRWLFVAASVK
jgi:hypothetical protein